jgi:osmotically-inducible protein OsmY
VVIVSFLAQRAGSDAGMEPIRMKWIVIAGLVIAACGCNREDTDKQPDEKVSADNTEKNERDKKPGALTPGDQSESEADLKITQTVRQEVVKKDDLSTNATNVKIITNDGVVTLRGPVESEKERAIIVSIAQGTAGVKRVDNQLEVASK